MTFVPTVRSPLARLPRKLAYLLLLFVAAATSSQAVTAYKYTFTSFGGTLEFITPSIIQANQGGGFPPMFYTQGSATLTFTQSKSFNFSPATNGGTGTQYSLLAFAFSAFPSGPGTYPAGPLPQNFVFELPGGNYSTGSLTITQLNLSTAPGFSKSFGATGIPVGGATSLTFTITNSNATGLTGLQFTDTLPSGLQVSSPSGLTNGCGGTVTATAGTGTVSLSGGTVAASSNCTIVLNVKGTIAGTKNNVTSALFSNEGFPGSPASASVTVAAVPGFSKNFGAASIPLSGSTSLTFTITNSNAFGLSGVSFTDTLPSGLQVSSPSGLTNSCGGTVTATAGTGSISLSGGTVAASSNCTITLNVKGTSAGTKNNTTSAISSNESGAGSTASASVTVVGPPGFSKNFGTASIPLGGSTSLTFTITNSNGTGLSGVSFTDTLPSGLQVSSPSGLTNGCGGTVTATAGTGTVSLSGGSVAASSNCTITLNVKGTSAGTKNNTTSAISSNEGGAGGTAVASVTVIGPPGFSKNFGVANIPLGGSTSLTFTITNSNASGLSGVSFTDTLPSGLQVSSPSGLTNGCGGTVTATSGTGSISLSGGTVAASSNCTITLNVTGTSAGTKNNTTSTISSNEGGAGGTASASVTVTGPPSITKSFNPSQFLPGGSSTLMFTITNPNPSGLTGVGFTDNLPAGMLVGTPSTVTSTCNGTTTAGAGTATITLAGGSIGPNGTCSINVNVTAANAGTYVNTTSAATSNEGGSSASGATATAIVAQSPMLTKAFQYLSIPIGASANVTFTLANPNQAIPLTGVAFTDTLPTGLIVSTPSGLSTTCNGTITAVAGSNSISASGVSLAAPGGTCSITVSVKAIAAGVQVNTTSTVSSDQTVAGSPATATITVGDVFEISYASNLTAGDGEINITNTGVNGAQLDGPGIGSPAGNICVNVYAFSPDEQLISCCSCLVTPNGLVSLSIVNDIVTNTLTGVRPSSVVVKLISTLAGAGGSSTSCTNSAAAPNPLAPGLQAWRTSIHAAPAGGFDATETPFTQATLSAAELSSVANRCTNIIGNGSSFGICKACRAGGLGAGRQ